MQKSPQFSSVNKLLIPEATHNTINKEMGWWNGSTDHHLNLGMLNRKLTGNIIYLHFLVTEQQPTYVTGLRKPGFHAQL